MIICRTTYKFRVAFIAGAASLFFLSFFLRQRSLVPYNITPSVTPDRILEYVTKPKPAVDSHHDSANFTGRLDDEGLGTPDKVIATQLEQAQCSTPALNVAFVKTHKAGSSTVANILQRFGVTHNLTFALPDNKIHTYGYNYISRTGDILTPAKFIPLADGSRHGYNILYNHAIYNRTAFRMVMPRDTSYIGILREPFSQFVSAFEYYNGEKSLKINVSGNSIQAYLQNPSKYEPNPKYFSYFKNKQAQDFGLGWNEYFIPSKLSDYIANLDKDFSLVMIMEHFDESLLLLKRKLCWDFKDILYITKNKNTHKKKFTFSDDDHARHRKLSHLDYSLYSHFLDKFKVELKHQNEEFYQELAHFRGVLSQVKDSCNSKKTLSIPESPWHSAMEITRGDCGLMMMSELAAHDFLLNKARHNVTDANAKNTNDSKIHSKVEQTKS